MKRLFTATGVALTLTVASALIVLTGGVSQASWVGGHCSAYHFSDSIFQRRTSQSYAAVAAGEGYEWGGGCWNDNCPSDGLPTPLAEEQSRRDEQAFRYVPRLTLGRERLRAAYTPDVPPIYSGHICPMAPTPGPASPPWWRCNTCGRRWVLECFHSEDSERLLGCSWILEEP